MTENSPSPPIRAAFVTGVSRGLGLELARQLLDAGASVFGCSRGEPDLLRGRAGFHFVSADLGAPDAPGVLRGLLQPADRIDLAVLNAGLLGEIRDLADTPVEELKRITEVNLWANKWIVDLLFEDGRSVGQVVAVSSGAATTAYRGWGAYSISKAALNMLVALQAPEHPGTHFAAVAPGLVDTAMQDYLTSLPDDPRYGPVAKLKEAKSSGSMPTAAQAAARLLQLLPKFRQRESGSFLDVRDFPAA